MWHLHYIALVVIFEHVAVICLAKLIGLSFHSYKLTCCKSFTAHSFIPTVLATNRIGQHVGQISLKHTLALKH